MGSKGKLVTVASDRQGQVLDYTIRLVLACLTTGHHSVLFSYFPLNTGLICIGLDWHLANDE